MLDADDDARRIIRKHWLNRDRSSTENRLFNNYFFDDPAFPGDYFRKCYRMSKSLFLRIAYAITDYSAEPLPSYFKSFEQRYDCTHRLGFDIYQKCTSAILQLTYRIAPDAFDEYLYMGRQTSSDCLENYCKCIVYLFSAKYLRKPTEDDVHRLHAKHYEIHGFQRMLGSLDCMHCAWKNFSVVWQGNYTSGDHEGPTIMLEVVATYDM
ncbi:uncharacterized protein [Rutidosis leptorrhynchoides]|uniref:uncharacterized protein n=1 Tax=Rutidosis leptorrhynchoides TaxID=125765 RepID=UPI003A992778